MGLFDRLFGKKETQQVTETKPEEELLETSAKEEAVSTTSEQDQPDLTLSQDDAPAVFTLEEQASKDSLEASQQREENLLKAQQFLQQILLAWSVTKMPLRQVHWVKLLYQIQKKSRNSRL